MLKPQQLESGMTLQCAIRRGAMVLLPAGKKLSGDDIAILQRRYPEQRVRVYDAGLDDVVQFEEDDLDNRFVAAVMDKTAAVMQQVMADTTDDRPHGSAGGSNFTAIERAVSNVIAFLLANPVGKILPKVPFAPESYLADHMANVFYLAMRLGSKIQWYVTSERERQTNCRDLSPLLAKSLLPLGLGALYMDMGMIGLSDLDDHTGPLSEEDWKRVFAHPEVSAEMLPDTMPATARMVVRTHHENCNQTGYPRRPDPSKVHVFTRIIRIVDVFDAATTPRPYRTAKSAIRTLWEMTYGPHHAQFDPTIVSAFNEMVMPFPVGTRIELDSGDTAVVCGQSKDPFTPKVVVAIDANGKVKSADAIGKPILLDEESGLRMRRVDGEDVRYLYEHSAKADADHTPDNSSNASRPSTSPSSSSSAA